MSQFPDLYFEDYINGFPLKETTSFLQTVWIHKDLCHFQLMRKNSQVYHLKIHMNFSGAFKSQISLLNFSPICV